MLPRTVEEEGEILFGPHAHTQTKPARARRTEPTPALATNPGPRTHMGGGWAVGQSNGRCMDTLAM